MDPPTPLEVWEVLFEKLGDDLRGVIRFQGTEYEAELREDVRQKYSSAEDRRVVDNAIINQLATPKTEEAYKTGELDAFVNVFDEAWVIILPMTIPSKSGYIVSVQRDGGTATMDDVDWTIDRLTELLCDHGVTGCK